MGELERVIVGDGIYVEFFAVKDGVKLPFKTFDMKDFMRKMAEASLDAIEKTIGIPE